jgi:tRNA U34 2-thiouridine synthase MnmA/TrmU
MKPLYALVEQYRELERLDVEEIDEQALADTLEALSGEITVKATNCALFARNIETFADTVDEAAQQMAERAKRMRQKAAGVRAYLLNQMRGAGITKIQAPEFTVSIRKNPAAVQIAPDAAIPQEYMVVPEPPPPRPDKRKLAEALKAGAVIDGCHLEQTERLDIR